MKFDQDSCENLWFELNPRVRCAFGNVSFQSKGDLRGCRGQRDHVSDLWRLRALAPQRCLHYDQGELYTEVFLCICVFAFFLHDNQSELCAKISYVFHQNAWSSRWSTSSTTAPPSSSRCSCLSGRPSSWKAGSATQQRSAISGMFMALIQRCSDKGWTALT